MMRHPFFFGDDKNLNFFFFGCLPMNWHNFYYGVDSLCVVFVWLGDCCFLLLCFSLIIIVIIIKPRLPADQCNDVSLTEPGEKRCRPLPYPRATCGLWQMCVKNILCRP